MSDLVVSHETSSSEGPDSEVDLLPQYAKAEDIALRCSKLFHQEDQIPHPEWLRKYFILDTRSSGVSGPLDCWPNQLAIAHTFNNDDIQFIGVQKCTRWGYTKIKCATELRAAANLSRKVIAYQPSDDERDGYYLDELQIALERSRSISSQMMATSPHSKSPFNRKDRIAFKTGVIHNLGGNSPKNYRRRTADLVTLDEFDEYDENIGNTKGKKQGSPVMLAQRAIRDSPFKKLIVGSSPTVDMLSNIQSVINSLDHVFYRFVPCPNCNEFIHLRFGDLYKTDFGIRVVDDDASTAEYMCEKCSALFDWQVMHDIDFDGEYRSGNYINGEFKPGEYIIRDSDGLFTNYTEKMKDRYLVETPQRIGFKLNSMLSDFVDWTTITEEYLQAEKEKKLGKFEKAITFCNHVDGEVWIPIDYEQIKPGEFEQDHAVLYKHEVPLGVKFMTFGVDVASKFIDITHVGYGIDDICWAIKHTKIYFEENELNTTKLWDKVHLIVDQKFDHESGIKMQARKGIIDCGYSTQNVKAFCQRDPIRFFGGKGIPAKPAQELYKWPSSPMHGGWFRVDTGGDHANEIIHTNYTKKPSSGNLESGMIIFPERDPQDPMSQSDRGFNRDYYNGLLSDRRIKKRVRGDDVYSWEPREGHRNDPADCFKLAYIAYQICIDIFGIRPEDIIFDNLNNQSDSDIYAQISKLSSETYGR